MVGGANVTDGARRELDAGIEQGERDALRRERRRSPRLDLPALGIRDGDQLEFTGKTGSPLTVEVVEAARQLVKVGDETLHLRDATRNVTGRDRDATVRQADHWSFKGKRLVDLLRETAHRTVGCVMPVNVRSEREHRFAIRTMGVELLDNRRSTDT